MLSREEILEKCADGTPLEEIFETAEEYQAALAQFSGYNKAAYTPTDLFTSFYTYTQRTLGEKIQKFHSNGAVSVVPKPITIEGFCAHAGITPKQLEAYTKNDKFGDIADTIKVKILALLIENGLVGNYNNKLVGKMLAAMDDRYKEKVEETNITFNLSNLQGMSEEECTKILNAAGDNNESD